MFYAAFQLQPEEQTSYLCSLPSFVLIKPPCEKQWEPLQSGDTRRSFICRHRLLVTFSSSLVRPLVNV
jgi:hypothetical protein